MKKGIYKLVGALNIYEYTQDFVYPVFERDGLFYLIESKNNKIKEFKLIINKNQLSKFYNFNSDNTTYTNTKKLYIVGDKVPYIFQTDKNKFLVLDLKTCLDFIKTFNTNDEVLKIIFRNFINDNEKYLIKENKVLTKQKKY